MVATDREGSGIARRCDAFVVSREGLTGRGLRTAPFSFLLNIWGRAKQGYIDSWLYRKPRFGDVTLVSISQDLVTLRTLVRYSCQRYENAHVGTPSTRCPLPVARLDDGFCRFA